MDFLYDIGNVIVHVDFIPSLKQLIPEGTENIDARLEAVIERKDEFEAGRITPDDYFPWAAKTLGFSGDMDVFMKAWTDIFELNTPMVECIESLHTAGHRLLLFSNIQNAHIEYLREHYPVFKHFSGGIYSYQTGHIKPEPQIYQIAVDQFGLTPEKTAYIDDLPANIQGGQKAGFLCHEYRADQHQDFLRWLDSL